MSNVVFILGAGASRRCGGPLMSDFLDVASDLLWSKRVEDKREDFTRVFEAIGKLQVVHSKAQLDLDNIESVFTVLELGKIIRRVPGLDVDDIPRTIASLKEVIVKTLEMKILFPATGRSIGVPEPYRQFAEMLTHLHEDAFPTRTTSVITFNYDVAVDFALHRASLGPDYVLSPVKHRSKHSVPLLKLHGSLNWATERASEDPESEAGRIRPIHMADYFNRYNHSHHGEHSNFVIPIGSQLCSYFQQFERVLVNPEPLIVPPSWNKADYHSALSDVWAAAAKHLSEAEQIFIIGYSLPETDSFFRHLYALGSVGNAPLRRIAVFDPDESGQVDARFKALLGPGAAARYEYHRRDFGDAIQTIQRFFPGKG